VDRVTEKLGFPLMLMCFDMKTDVKFTSRECCYFQQLRVVCAQQVTESSTTLVLPWSHS